MISQNHEDAVAFSSQKLKTGKTMESCCLVFILRSQTGCSQVHLNILIIIWSIEACEEANRCGLQEGVYRPYPLRNVFFLSEDFSSLTGVRENEVQKQASMGQIWDK